MTHCSYRDATRQVASESGDPDAVTLTIWWAVIAVAAIWAAAIYYGISWLIA